MLHMWFTVVALVVVVVVVVDGEHFATKRKQAGRQASVCQANRPQENASPSVKSTTHGKEFRNEVYCLLLFWGRKISL